MEFSEIYKTVFEINPSLKDKIENEGEDFCVINFHEYLTLGFDADYIDINHGFTHAHLDGADNKLFFDIIQGLYKSYLKGKGVIELDFRERGAHDYRKDACITIGEFEKIVIYCILYYNNQRILENFSYTEKMLTEGVKPTASSIWNYGLNNKEINLINVDYNTLCT